LNKQREEQKLMPEIEIEINTETDEMETEIKGIAGSACEKTAQIIKKVFGKPVMDEKTREFHSNGRSSSKSKESNFLPKLKAVLSEIFLSDPFCIFVNIYSESKSLKL
jgi:hypothetical protein